MGDFTEVTDVQVRVVNAQRWDIDWFPRLVDRHKLKRSNRQWEFASEEELPKVLDLTQVWHIISADAKEMRTSWLLVL